MGGGKWMNAIKVNSNRRFNEIDKRAVLLDEFKMEPISLHKEPNLLI